MKYAFTLIVILVSGLLASAEADVVYLDADQSNTLLTDGSGLTFSPGTEGDDLWNSRAFGNGGTVITSNEASEDAPRLETTISGLTAGETYDVYAYFWGAGNTQLWRGRAGLIDTAGDLQGYNTAHFNGSSFLPMTYVTSPPLASSINPGPLSTADGAGFENGGYFSGSVLTEEADRRLFEISLGTAVADASGNISVFIDDLANTSSGNRTWYDGVGSQLVVAVPEPGTAGILMLAGLFAVGSRRRK